MKIWEKVSIIFKFIYTDFYPRSNKYTVTSLDRSTSSGIELLKAQEPIAIGCDPSASASPASGNPDYYREWRSS
jgi:hypothetical protein